MEIGVIGAGTMGGGIAQSAAQSGYEVMLEDVRMEMVSFSECFASEDHMEGIYAFLEKRKPRFKGV